MHAYKENYWRIKYWPKVTNRQNLLLANILSYTVITQIGRLVAITCSYSINYYLTKSIDMLAKNTWGL